MPSSSTYPIGPAQGLETDLYAPDGDPWCNFWAGSILCTNGGRCRNPRHRDTVRGAQEMFLAMTGRPWS